MKSLHIELRESRIEKGISLEDIYRETKIRTALLEHIEEGNYTVVPEPFMRAFLREYAAAVGLDPEKVIARFEGKQVALREEAPEPSESRVDSAPIPEKTPSSAPETPAPPSPAPSEDAAPADAGTGGPAPSILEPPPVTPEPPSAPIDNPPERTDEKRKPLFPDDEPKNHRTLTFVLFIVLIIVATLAILFINGNLSF
jgi:hypothetical protein